MAIIKGMTRVHEVLQSMMLIYDVKMDINAKDGFGVDVKFSIQYMVVLWWGVVGSDDGLLLDG